VRPGINLQQLHRILQIVMGWETEHLHEFRIGEESYSDITILNEGFLDQRKAILGVLIRTEKQKFLYIYDFGDNWNHEILMEKIVPEQVGTKYPFCLTGKRACPPEDCGGVYGYDELLEQFQDPSNPDHEEALELLDADFDPEKFDLELVNKRLRSLR
jgi:hypothetical protein